MSLYTSLRKFLFQIDPETAHHAMLAFARGAQGLGFPLAFMRWLYQVQSAELETVVWNTRFANPVGLAAGYDKNARTIDFMAALGFGYVEIGSVTNLESTGNPRPRLFRLEPDHALINRLGLNNDGVDAVSHRLRARGRSSVPLGVNIAKTHHPEIMGQQAVEDIAGCYRQLSPLADYVVLNVSCPNTREGKTFEDPGAFVELLGAINADRKQLMRTVPLLVKFSPDVPLSTLEELLRLSEEQAVDGYVVCNTTVTRDALMTEARVVNDIGKGGLSGRPLFQRARERVEFVYRATEGRKPIIGGGGVDSSVAAYEMVRSGASLVQLYTGLVYQGPGLVASILHGLIERVRGDGLRNIREAVGTAVQ